MSKVYFLIGSFFPDDGNRQKLIEHLQQLEHDTSLRCMPERPYFPSYSILCNEQRGSARQPRGYAQIYNGLVRAALHDDECEYFWLLNDDALPLGHCLHITPSTLDYNADVGAVFPVEAWPNPDGAIVSMDPETAVEKPLEELLSLAHVEKLFAGFACVCIRRQAWLDVGEMDESLGRGYNEDLDWGIRAWKAGWRIINKRDQAFLHKRGATFNKLVADGRFRAEEPYEGAAKVKEKWPWLWSGEHIDVTMARLRGWFEDARKGK